MSYPSFTKSLLIGTACLALAACASSTQKVQPSGSKYDAKINAAIERAAKAARDDGEESNSIALMERLYRRDAKNPESATKFAHALRQAGELDKAEIILKPFATASDAGTDVLAEYAALNLGLTKYPLAENYARKAVDEDEKNFRAWQILGIALDGQGRYKDAETAFRKALDLWQGDPIPVMNNLALNLTNQERLDEALEIMQRAKAAAPNRVEVERNLRIIRTLNESADGRPAPKPTEKPAAKPTTLPLEDEAETAAPTNDQGRPVLIVGPDKIGTPSPAK